VVNGWRLIAKKILEGRLEKNNTEHFIKSNYELGATRRTTQGHLPARVRSLPRTTRARLADRKCTGGISAIPQKRGGARHPRSVHSHDSHSTYAQRFFRTATTKFRRLSPTKDRVC
jgi:hypothetical protein